jgi:hypothetical protein
VIKWTVERPRSVAEDDRETAEVDANSIEVAIQKACKANGWRCDSGAQFIVHARVQVVPRPSLPLESF